MVALIAILASLALPLWLTASGVSARRVAIASLIASMYAFGLAAAYGSIDIGPHIECPGWLLGAIFTTFLMVSCGLCLACRRLSCRQGQCENHHGTHIERIIKFSPHLVGLSGLVIVFIGLAIGPGVPYQDPTPVMRALEIRQDQRSQRVAAFGLCIFTGGALWGTTRWCARRCTSRKIA